MRGQEPLPAAQQPAGEIHQVQTTDEAAEIETSLPETQPSGIRPPGGQSAQPRRGRLRWRRRIEQTTTVKERRPRPDIPWLGTFGLLVTVGSLLFAAYQYREARQEAAALPPNLSISSSMREVGIDGDMLALQGSITIRNNGQNRVKVLAGFYNLHGVTGRERSVSETSDAAYTEQLDLAFGNNLQWGLAMRHYQPDLPTIIQSGSLFPPGAIVFDPGQEYTFTFAALAPNDEYDLIGLAPYIYYARREVALGSSELTEAEIDDYDGLVVGIDWQWLQTGQLYAALRVKQQDGPWRAYAELPVDEQAELQRRYWLVSGTSFYELPLWDAPS